MTNAPARLDPLSELRAAGLTVKFDAGVLIVSPASAITDAHRQILRDRRTFTVAALKVEADELADLARQCGDAYGFTGEEHAEALAAALRDPMVALECFRLMRAGLKREGKIQGGGE